MRLAKFEKFTDKTGAAVGLDVVGTDRKPGCEKKLVGRALPEALSQFQKAPPQISVPSLIADGMSDFISASWRFLVKSQGETFLAGFGSPMKLHGRYQARPDSIA